MRKRAPRLASSRRGWRTRGFAQLERQCPRQGQCGADVGKETIPFQSSARCGRVKGDRNMGTIQKDTDIPLWSDKVLSRFHSWITGIECPTKRDEIAM